MKNQEEIYRALLDGEIIQQNRNQLRRVHLKDGNLRYVDGLRATKIFDKPSEWEIYKEPEWFESIPKCGVPCRVWDEGDFPRIGIVIDYTESYNYPFMVLGNEYENAEPMPKSEIQQWLDNAPE